jgi:hypothetical protein
MALLEVLSSLTVSLEIVPLYLFCNRHVNFGVQNFLSTPVEQPTQVKYLLTSGTGVSAKLNDLYLGLSFSVTGVPWHCRTGCLRLVCCTQAHPRGSGGGRWHCRSRARLVWLWHSTEWTSLKLELNCCIRCKSKTNGDKLNVEGTNSDLGYRNMINKRSASHVSVG